LGLILAGRGDPSAQQEFAAALAANPDSVEAMTELGKQLRQQGRMREAVEQLTAALATNPNYLPAHYYLGVFLLQQGKPAEALRQEEEVLRIHPLSAEAYVPKGDALMRLGQPAEALAAFKRAVELAPTNASFHYDLGIALCRQGQEAAGQAEFYSATQVDSRWPAFARESAWSLATDADPRVRNGSLALQLAQQASAATGNSVPIFLDTLAAAQAEAGRFTDAVATARRALEQTTGLPSDLIRQIKDRLKLYQHGQPFHEKLASAE
jgi:tetratricopeptide (TPR) repeat protein